MIRMELEALDCRGMKEEEMLILGRGREENWRWLSWFLALGECTPGERESLWAV